jgi:hypothetical protein
MAPRFTRADMLEKIQDSMGHHLLMRSREHTPARSADLITAETSEAFRLAGSRALEADSTVAAVLTQAAASMAVAARMAVAEGIDDRKYTHLELVKIQQWR